MSPARWEQLTSIFETALRRKGAAREEFLDRACAGDSELRRLAAEMLAGADSAGSFLGETRGEGGERVFPDGLLVDGRFRVVRFITRGGMGEVYEAFDERLRLRVAMKTIRPELAGDPESVARFEREIRVAREVTHENLCRVYDLVEHELAAGLRITCFTMEYLEGESLQERLQRGPMAPDEALPLIRQMAAALETLHRAGIVHRDLKPGNVMLVDGDGGPRAVVTDFGLAKPLADEKDPFESQLDLQAGAPYFMAPELLRRGGRPSQASDIYAFGLVIDEMVTPRRAFPAQSIQELRDQKATADPVPPADRARALPAHWSAAILRCLSRDPAGRFATPADVVAALTVTAPAAGKRRRWPRVGAWVAGASAAVLSAVVYLGAPPPARETGLVVFDLEETSERPLRLGRAVVGEVVNGLAPLDGLRVARYYEPRSRAPLASIAERLHLDGDLERIGERLRLTLRLTDAPGRRVLWSSQFSGVARDPLDLQSQAAAGVKREMERRLVAEATAHAGLQYAGYQFWQPLGQQLRAWFAQKPSIDPAAYESYVRGRQLWDDRTLRSTLAAIENYEQAIARDPRFALPHAAIAEARGTLMEHRYAPPLELIARARRSAEQAVALDPESADTQLALAAVHQLEWNWPAAEKSFRKAIALQPKHWRARRLFGSFLFQFGRFNEALAQIQQGAEMDPYDYPAQSAYALHLNHAGRHQEALAVLERTLRQKDFLYARQMMGETLVYLSRQVTGVARQELMQRALQEAGKARQHELRGSSASGSPSTPMSDLMFASYLQQSGRPREALPFFKRVEEIYRTGKGGATPLAFLSVLQGRHERAIELLEEAARNRERWLLSLKVHPCWQPLAQRDGYRRIVERMRL